MNIYAVTIYGDKFYFYGNLSAEECEIIMHICSDLSEQCGEKGTIDLFENFMHKSNNLLRNKIFQIRVKQLFRINKG